MDKQFSSLALAYQDNFRWCHKKRGGGILLLFKRRKRLCPAEALTAHKEWAWKRSLIENQNVLYIGINGK
jgi:hypothetical protein